MVAGGVHSRLEPGGGRSIEEPPPRGEVGVAEARPVDAPACDCTDPRELVEVVAHPVAVDAQLQRPRSTKRPRPGAPTSSQSATMTSPRLIVVTG